TYSGDANRDGGASGSATESISQAGTEVILVPHAIFRRKKVVSIGLATEVQPSFPGAAVPTGTVRFLFKKRQLGTVTLVGGQATLTLKAARVPKKAITVVYDGDRDFQSNATTLVVRTS